MAEKQKYETYQQAGIETGNRQSGTHRTTCPKCSSERTHKKQEKCLAVNLDKRVWWCHHCGWTDCLLSEDKRFSGRKTYFIPKEPPPGLSEPAKKYINDRGISDYTIRYFKVTDGEEFLPQVNAKKRCLRFPYYRYGSLVNIKFRDRDKNFKQVKDAELIFFNIDSISGEEECVIVEGEFDCMAAYEAGYKLVTSVPNGAVKRSSSGTPPAMEYLDSCFDDFISMKRIVLATDSDGPGITLRNELARRLGKHRCYIVEFPTGCKDFNDVLLRHGNTPEGLTKGKAEIISLIEGAKPIPIEGIRRVEEMEMELDQYRRDGDLPGDRIGFREFDDLFSFQKDEFTVITGIPGSGKSAFLDQCLVRLASRYGWKHGICSFEKVPTKRHIGNLSACFIGQKFTDLNDIQWFWSKYFLNEHFLFFNIEEIDVSVDGLLDKAKELVMRHGINSLVIDPWNYVEFTDEKGKTETLNISRELSKILKFCRAFDVHVFLVAHPVKMPKERYKDKITQEDRERYAVPNLYSIAGSGTFFSKPDNGMTVYLDEYTKETVVYVQKVRHANTGKKGMTIFTYEVGVGRYAESGLSYSEELPIYLQRIGANYEDAQQFI